jgi:hypothetical protein
VVILRWSSIAAKYMLTFFTSINCILLPHVMVGDETPKKERKPKRHIYSLSHRLQYTPIETSISAVLVKLRLSRLPTPKKGIW